MLTTPFTIGKGQHPMKPHRMRMVHDLIVNYDMHRKMDMCVCAPLSSPNYPIRLLA